MCPHPNGDCYWVAVIEPKNELPEENAA